MFAKKAFAVGGGLAAAGLLALSYLSVPETSAAADPAVRTEVIDLDVSNDQFVLTDVGEPGVSIGDEYVFSDELYQGGRQVGDDGGACQVTHVEGQEITTNCVISVRLPDGQITAQTLWVRGTDSLMAITGGTGKYRTARGEVEATDVQTLNEKVRITIVL
ncbi:dirigent protein [Saccharopolyspora sp. NPDC050389]|uniref:dirigent protein n=1 Tax=Saccharopolyspora sp. NPDC050389 TaxID=3155516 RepID=UPI0034007797